MKGWVFKNAFIKVTFYLHKYSLSMPSLSAFSASQSYLPIPAIHTVLHLLSSSEFPCPFFNLFLLNDLKIPPMKVFKLFISLPIKSNFPLCMRRAYEDCCTATAPVKCEVLFSQKDHLNNF